MGKRVLTGLHISDMLLIESLSLDMQSGLTVLTGETGAGKTILLDALGLALGGRADNSLIRQTAKRARVTAYFTAPAPESPLDILLRSHGFAPDVGESLLIRRDLLRDSASRAFINDQPCSATFLRQIGSYLVEIHGQNDGSGMLSPKEHRALLDSFGACDTTAVKVAYTAWQAALEQLTAYRDTLAEAQRDRDWLAHCLAELQNLAPQHGEEEALANRRTAMQKCERLTHDLIAIRHMLAGSEGAPALLRSAARQLSRLADADDFLTAALTALDRAIIDIDEAESHLIAATERYNFDPAQLDTIEMRLFDLRALARKHATPPDALATLAEDFAVRHAALEAGEQGLQTLEQQMRDTAHAYEQCAASLSTARHQAAARLDTAVAAELSPLRLNTARFETMIAHLPRERWGAQGMDRVEFTIATNADTNMEPLAKIASGGELSRFILALKVALAEQGGADLLIFDEIDRGVGGAVASAVGARLARLASEGKQLIVVTHSPQVAARGTMHYLVSKKTKLVHTAKESPQSPKDSPNIVAQTPSGSDNPPSEIQVTYTQVHSLTAAERREEIARMLSGDKVTDEARSQASRLIESQ